MSLNQILRGTGNRRAADKIAELRAENRALLRQKAAADDAFALLHQERRQALDSADALRTRVAETELVAGCLARTVDDLTAERDGLYEEVVALRIRLAPYTAAEATSRRSPSRRWSATPAQWRTRPPSRSQIGRAHV